MLTANKRRLDDMRTCINAYALILNCEPGPAFHCNFGFHIRSTILYEVLAKLSAIISYFVFQSGKQLNIAS